jgi:hypothetical protein
MRIARLRSARIGNPSSSTANARQTSECGAFPVNACSPGGLEMVSWRIVLVQRTVPDVITEDFGTYRTPSRAISYAV